jgi:hypothetical protein
MGASNFTYVEATWTQTLGDWIGAHTRAFAAIGGVPRLIIPDNANIRSLSSRPACTNAGQSNLCRDGGALRHRRAANPTAPTARQDDCLILHLALVMERWLGRRQHGGHRDRRDL